MYLKKEYIFKFSTVSQYVNKLMYKNQELKDNINLL